MNGDLPSWLCTRVSSHAKVTEQSGNGCEEDNQGAGANEHIVNRVRVRTSGASIE